MSCTTSRNQYLNKRNTTIVTVCGIILLLNIYLIFLNDRNIIRDPTMKEPELPILMKPDNQIRHCITDEIIGSIPSTTQVVDFIPVMEGISESPTSRIKSFEDIFKYKIWGKAPNETVIGSSGPGSTLNFTHEIRGVLHKIINDIKTFKGNNYKVKMLDVPCGDFAWMSRFLSTRDDIEYTGMDIVPELIENHKNKFKNKKWNFVNQDIAESNGIENYDIILCRMLLQHLLIADTMRILKVFSTNSSGLLITTTFSKTLSNSDLKSTNADRFRRLNLEIPPFSLIPPACMSRDGPPGYLEEIIGVWKLPLRQVSNCTSTHHFTVKHFNAIFYSCTNWNINVTI